jgi:Putative phage metallopeptidase
MATFTSASKECRAIVRRAIEHWHQWMLGDAFAEEDKRQRVGCPEVAITVQFANPTRGEDGEAKSPALAEDAWPVAGKVKLTSHHDRVAGLDDVIIDIDEELWDEMSEQRQLALADSLLTRVELKLKDGIAVLDDCGRPKLMIRKPDAKIGSVYYGVIERHGRDAAEAQSIAKVVNETEKFVQGTFNYGTWG